MSASVTDHSTVTATSTDLDAARDQHRRELLDQLDQHRDYEIPCRAVDLHTAGAWTSEEDNEQRVAAAACRSRPCPALEACRAYGDAWPLELGAYGGRTQTERRRAARQMKKSA